MKLERLEDRTVPALQLTYGGTGASLSLTEVTAAADNVTITEPVANTLRIDLNGATFDAGSTAAATGLTYNNGTPGASTFVTVDISAANAITTLTANLGAMDDTLSLGMTNANGGVGNVAIDGQAGNDAVTLNALTLGGQLTVAAERVNLAGNINTDGPVDLSNVGAAVVTAAVTVDTEQGNDNAGGAFTLNGSLSADVAGRTLVVVTSTAASAPAGNIALGTFDASGGAQLDALDLNADSPTQRGDISLPGGVNTTSLFQINLARNVSAGASISSGTVTIQNVAKLTLPTGANVTATTANLNLNAVTVDLTGTGGTNTLSAGGAADLTASNITSSGTPAALAISAQQAVTVQDVNVSSTVSISANQDGAGTEGYVQNGSITTTDASASAVSITVNTAGGGTGSASLKGISVGSGGTISVNANGGSISGSGTLTATNLAVQASTGIGASGAGNALNTAVSNLVARTSTGGIFVSNTGAVTIGFTGEPFQGVTDTGASGAVTLTNAGTVTIAAANEDISSRNGTATVNATGANADVLLSQAQIAGDSAVSVSVTAGRDVILDNGGKITGFVLPLGANSVTVSAGHNITLQATTTPGAFISSGSVATLTTGAGGTFTNNAGAGGGVFSNTGSPGNIAISADNMVLNDPINATGTVTLDVVTTNRAIDLGTNPSTGKLGLAQSDLNQVTASILRIGDESGINSDITVTSAITDVGTGWNTLSLATNNGVSGAIGQNGGASLTVTNLRAFASGFVNLTDAGNAIAQVSGIASGAFSVVDSTSLTVGNVDPTLGFPGVETGFGGVVSLTVLGAGNVLTVTNAIDTTVFGNTADVTLSADDMAINAAIKAPNHIVTLQQASTTTRNISIGAGTTATTLGLSDAELGQVTASTLRVGRTDNAGNLTVDGPVTAHVGYSTLSLLTGGAVLDNNPTEPDIAVTNLALRAANGISLDTAVTDLAVRNTTTGNVRVANTGATTLTAVDTLNGTAGNQQGNFGPGGTTTFSAASPFTYAINFTSAATITTTATETVPPTPNVDNVTVNANVTVQSTGGDVIFQAGDNIVVSAGAQVLATAGNVSFASGFGDNDGEGAQTLDGTISASASTGVVTLNLSAQQGATQAGTGTISGNQLLLLGTGTAGSFALGTSNTNAVNTIAASTAASILYKNSQALTVGTVGATPGITSTNSDVTLQTLVGDLNLANSINAGNGNVSLTAAGALTQSVAGTGVTGNAVTLTAPNGIGTAAQNLTLSATTLSAGSSGNNGNQFLSASGTAKLAVTNALNAGAGTITLTGGTFQIQAGAGGNAVADTSQLTVNSPAILDLNGQSEAVNGLNGNGTVTDGAAATTPTLTVGLSGGSGAFAGVIQNGSGTVKLTKSGAGTETLSGANTYTGTTTVSAGTLLVDGSTAAASAFTVSGGILGGNGTVGGTVSNSAAIDPGDTSAPGVLNTGAVTFNPGSSFDAQIGGTTPGTGAGRYDQLNVTGAVALGGGNATLNLSSFGGFTPSASDEYVLIQSTGGVTGTFAGLPEGAVVSTNFLGSGLTARITYQGGANADAVALVVDGPFSYTATVGGNLRLRFNSSDNNLELLVNGTVVDARPLAGVQSVTINAANAATTLTIDYVFGGVFVIPGGGTITFNGVSGNSNALVINGGAFNTDTYTYTGPNSGSVQLGVGGQVIQYTGLTPIVSASAAANIVFNLPGGTVGASLQDDGTAGNNNSQLASTNATFEMVTFTDPTNSLTVNAGGGTDTITTATNLSGDFNVGLTLNGTAATDSIILNALNLTAGAGNLSATGNTITLNAAITTVNAQNYNGAVTLGANDTLTSTGGGNVTFGSTVNGAFGLAVNTAGVTTFASSVGGTVALTSLTTDAAGSTGLNGGSVTTTGAQTYNDLVILSTNTTLTSTGSGNVAFVSTVNGAFGLTVNTAGVTTFGGPVGTTTALASLTTDAAGSTALNGGTVTTTGAQTYNDAIALGATTTLNSLGGSNIAFGSTVNGAFGLTVNTAGVTTFGGAVGATTALASVTTDAPGSTDLNGGPVTTTGAQTYNDPVILSANTTLTSTGAGAITLASTVNGAFDLTVNTGGVTTFGGTVGATTALASVTTDGPGSTDLNGGSVTTTGAQTYNDAVILSANTTLNSTGAGNVTLASTVNGAFDLTVNTGGVTTFGGIVGATTALASVTTDAGGSTDLNGGPVTTTGAQTYNDPVLLSANTTLNSLASGNITLGNTVNGAFGLTINTGGVTTFGGPVGGTTALTSVTTDAGGSTDLNGGPVTTTGAQTYNDPVLLSANTTLTSTGSGNITLGNTVNGAFSLTVNTGGLTTFGGPVGGITPLTTLITDGPGTTQINGGAITTTGNQTYNDNVTLGASTALNAGSGDVTFVGTLNGTTAGAQNLTLTTTGNVLFGGAVGATRLGTLTLANVANVTGNSTISATSIAETGGTGTTTFNGAVDTTTAAGINLSTAAIILSANVSAPGGSVAFNATTSGVNQTAGALTGASLVLTGAGTFTLNDATNDVTALTANVNGPLTYQDANTLNAAGVISTGAVTLTTGNTLTLSGALTGTAVTLNATTGGVNQTGGALTATTLLLTSGAAATGNFTVNQPGNNVGTLAAAVVTGAGGSLSYTGTGGAGNLTVGTVGAVNGISTGNAGNPGGNVTLTTSGTITVNQPISTASGAGGQLTASGSVTLNASVNLGAGNVTLDGGPNGDLVINAPQTSATTINFFSSRDIIVGALVQTTAAGASINLSADNDGLGNGDGVGGVRVLPAGQLFSAADVLAEGSDLFATPAGTPDSVRIDANSVNPANAQVSAVGNVIVRQRLIPQVPAGAHTIINGVVQSTGAGAVTISGQQAVELSTAVSSAGGPVTFEHVTTGVPTATTILLTGDSTVNAGAGSILFFGTIDGGFNLTATSNGTTTFTGAVGATNPLASVTANGTGTTALNGGPVTTVGAQAYNDAVTLGAVTTLNSLGTGNVKFASTVNGPFDLTVNTGGVTTFGGPVGGVAPLTSVTTDAPGSTDLNGGPVTTTTGAQTYNDPVLLSGNTTLTSNASGNITLASSVNGGFTLAVNTAGVTTFGGPVGGTAPLVSVTTDAPGSTDLNGGPITTTLAQTYNDPVLLSANTTLTSQSGNNVTFAGAVNGAFSLTVNTGGVTTFGGPVGGGTPLTSVTTDAPGATHINGGSVTTSGSQTYSDNVTLGISTALTAGLGDITFGGALDGATAGGQDLMLTANGNITFVGNVGAVNPLNVVTINTAVNVTNSGTFQATSLKQVAGTGTTAVNGAMTLSGVAGLDLTTNTIVLNANVSATAANATVRLDPTAGGVTQTAGALTAPNLLLNGVGTFLLDQPANVIGTLAAAVNGTVSVRDSVPILVGTVLATNGVTTTNGDFDLNSLGSITITQAINTGAGTVRLASGNVVSQSGAGVILTAAGLGVQATNAISLPLAGNVAGTFAARTTAANQPITFTATGGFTVGTVSADPTSGFTQTVGVSTNGGNVTLTATGLLTVGDGTGQGISAGSATVDLNAAGVTENTGSAITAANLRLQGAGTFTLMQGNDVNMLAAAVVGPLNYNDLNALTVGTVLGTPGINTNGNNLTLTTGGLLTLGTGAGEAVTAAGATADITAAGVTESANSAITAANLRLRGAGTFTLAQGNAVATLAAGTAGAIVFNDVNALTVGTVLGTAGIISGNNDVNLRTQAGSLTLANAITAGPATVTLNSAGAITQAAVAPITAGGLGILATGTVDLCSAGAANSVAVLAANDFAAGAPVLFGDAIGLTVGIVTFAPLFPGAGGVITTGNGNVTLEDMAGNLTLNNGIITGSGTVALTSAGTVTQSAVAPIVAGSLGLRATGTIDLLSANAPNQVHTLAAIGTNVLFNDTAHLTVGAVPAATCFAGAAGVHASGGTADLMAAGVDETAVDFITAANLRLRGTGTFALTNDSNNVDVLAAATTGPVNYHDANDLVVGTVLGTAGVNTGGQGGVTLVAAQGNKGLLTIGDGHGQGITASAPGAVVDIFAGSGVENTGSVITAANLRLQSGLPNGSFTLTQNNQVGTLAAQTAGLLTFTDARALTVGTVLGTAGITTGGGAQSVPVGSTVSSTAGVFDPATGTWFLRNDNSAGGPSFTLFQFGAPGWIPVVGDWNGDGTVTIGVVDPATMTWYLRDSNSAGAPTFTKFQFGAPGWIPVVGDWDGNGTTTVGAVDPKTETWYLRNSNSAGAPSITPFRFGAAGWTPVTGDWDGNHTTTVGAVDPVTMTWYLRNSNSAGAADAGQFRYGAPGWTPVVGDWDGNGTTTVGAFDPSTGTWYQKNSNSAGAPDNPPFAYGAANVDPVAGDWLPTKGTLRRTATVTAGGSNVTLITAGPLTLGGGAGEGIVAGGATVDLFSAGVLELAASTVSATNLRLQGNGRFILQQGNNLTTLAGNTSGGPVGVTAAGDLIVGVVNGTSGFTTNNHPLTLDTGGSLTVSSPVATGTAANVDTSFWMNIGTGLTFNAAVNTGSSSVIARVGLAAPAVVNINNRVTAFSANFVGRDDPTRGDTFNITPSDTTQFWIDGQGPTTSPGDAIFLRNLVNAPDGLPNANVTAFNVLHQNGSSKDGFFALDTRQFVHFKNIESVRQINVQVQSILLDAKGNFQLAASTNFTNRPLANRLNINNSGTPPFFLAPNLTNPVAPFGAPSVAVGDVNGDGVDDVVVGLGSGSEPLVVVVDGAAILRIANGGAPLDPVTDILTQFFAFDPAFRGGIFVAAGDVQNNGRAAIVVGAGAGNLSGTHVHTFINVAPSGATGQVPDGRTHSIATMQQLPGLVGSFDAYNPAFTGGVRVAVGDVNGDGHADIITAPGAGAEPRVNVYSGIDAAALHSFLAYDPAYQGGLSVAAGNFQGRANAAGRPLADILVGPNIGASPEVKVFQGDNLTLIEDFLAFHPLPVQQAPGSPVYLPGVSGLAFGGRESNGKLDLFVGVGPGGIGENNGHEALGFGFDGTNGYGPDAATIVFIQFAQSQDALLNGMQFGGVVTGQG